MTCIYSHDMYTTSVVRAFDSNAYCLCYDMNLYPTPKSLRLIIPQRKYRFDVIYRLCVSGHTFGEPQIVNERLEGGIW